MSVPAVQPAAPPPGEHLVRIDELPEWAQLAFGGYKALNRIQSRIFHTAFTSNENMLVCAPTGGRGSGAAASCGVVAVARVQLREWVLHRGPTAACAAVEAAATD